MPQTWNGAVSAEERLTLVAVFVCTFFFFCRLIKMPVTVIVHSPHVGTQISCFAPTNFSWRQAAYVDSFCWAAVQQQADSSPLWLHKVLIWLQHSLPGKLYCLWNALILDNSQIYNAVKKYLPPSWFFFLFSSVFFSVSFPTHLYLDKDNPGMLCTKCKNYQNLPRPMWKSNCDLNLTGHAPFSSHNGRLQSVSHLAVEEF